MKSLPRILVLNPTCLDVLQRCGPDVAAHPGFELAADDAIRSMAESDLFRAARNAGAWILPSPVGGFPSDRQMRDCPELQTVSIAASGHDWMDIEAATRHGVVVTYTPVREGAETVADLAIGMMIAAARQIPWHHQLLQAGRHDRGVGTLLWGKTLGIVGLGNIGKAVARRARGFDMRLLAAEPHPDQTFVEDLSIRLMSLDELLGLSDVVTLHVRLTEQTRGMIGRSELSRMKPSSFLVNTARRELVDEEALVQALESGRLAGAAIDDPPSDRHSPLLRLSNSVCTCHIGNRTLEGVAAVFRCAVNNAMAVLRGQHTPYVLNPNVYERPNVRVRPEAS